ncbi:hypothetical protein C8R43DRAFT_994889 [Mycena crocata]|nr:hypothetical protein C8R43DRAFT_994889 [Mycena crocata]
MPFLSPILLLLLVFLFPTAMAQDSSNAKITGTQNSKVAITGAVIGGVLVIICLIAVAVYGIDRCIHRRRRRPIEFTPVPTTEPYQYLSSPPAMRLAKSSPYRHDSYYSGTPTSPNARTSTYSETTLARSPGARSATFDPYKHGPFYPVKVASPPTSSSTKISPTRVLSLANPMAHSFSSDSLGTLSMAPTARSTTPSGSSVNGDQAPGTESRTLSRATSTTLNP